ncbi:recombinase family protein [Streptomyces sp. NPDC059631]|uniref:recombinase family protein n=1 Tax=unclassified Streptomyces TaxID=2593676 RepID=UPI0036A1D06B
MTPATPATFRPADEAESWIGYIRVSTWREEKISPELQQSAIEAWAKRTGHRIVDWIIDLDRTGRNFKRRIMSGIQRVEKGEAVGIAVWKFSRFGRNDLGIAVNLARLEHAGGHLESATEDVDVRTAVGRFNRRILFDLAVFESDRAGEMWKDAHRWRRAHGLPATGGKRLGYVWHPRKLPDPHRPGQFILQEERYEPDPHVGPDIEALFTRKVGGDGFASLAAWLNDRGHRTSTDAPWQADSLRRMMDAGFAAGLLRIHDPSCGCDYTANGGNCRRWLYIDGAHEPLITPELWERYEAHRTENKARTPRSRRPVYALTGLMRCGTCRKDAAATSARRQGQQIRGYAYMCSARSHAGTTICELGVWVQRLIVEEEVRGWLVREAAPDIDAAPSVATPQAPAIDERAIAARERARLQAEAHKLAGALVNLRVDRAANPDDYGPGEYEAARDRIRQQQQTNTAALERVVVVETTPHRADYRPVMLDLIDAWDDMNEQEKNSLLRQIARRVVVTREGRGSERTRVDVHPVWEPDPWDDKAEHAEPTQRIHLV